MMHLDLFSGIGGFALAVQSVWPEAEHIFCDNDKFCQAILKKHWPQSKIYEDIHGLTANAEREWKLQSKRGEPKKWGWVSNEIDLLTGGFPCQPFSQAGKRKGTDDSRHLWPEMRRVISEFKPRWIVGENVRGLLSIGGGMVFESVCVDLEAMGYEVQPFIIPACAINAPHRRDRIWLVAHAINDRQRSKIKGFNETQDRIQTEYRTKDGSAGESIRTVEQPIFDRHASNSQSKRRKLRERGSDDCPWDEKGIFGCKDSDAQNTVSERSGGRMEDSRQVLGRGCAEIEAARPDWSSDWTQVATRLCTLDDGLSDGLVRPRGWRNAALKGAGNAIVPQVAIRVMEAIKCIDSI